jgi:hypothetical protein
MAWQHWKLTDMDGRADQFKPGSQQGRHHHTTHNSPSLLNSLSAASQTTPRASPLALAEETFNCTPEASDATIEFKGPFGEGHSPTLLEWLDLVCGRVWASRRAPESFSHEREFQTFKGQQVRVSS